MGLPHKLDIRGKYPTPSFIIIYLKIRWGISVSNWHFEWKHQTANFTHIKYYLIIYPQKHFVKFKWLKVIFFKLLSHKPNVILKIFPGHWTLSAESFPSDFRFIYTFKIQSWSFLKMVKWTFFGFENLNYKRRKLQQVGI